MTILKSENNDALTWFKFKVLLPSSCFSAWLPKDRDVSAPSPQHRIPPVSPSSDSQLLGGAGEEAGAERGAGLEQAVV